ncbi:MAG TPA: SusD/RagB family nutrient-binding outer membrane lipoprotein [Legionellaceae bacterium]|nr:SusD/RagB family nutrient-binding outer membrane lipoprotein [Legionellaceae bacterium]
MKKLKFFIIAIGLIVSAGSCKKGFLSELQNDPNNPTDAVASVQLILPGTLTNLVNTVNSDGAYQPIGVWLGYWNYAGGYSFNFTVQNYVMSNTSPQVWDNYYGILTNLNQMKIKAATDPSLANYGAISDILSAFCYKNLVDAYNDIPYSQALQGQGNFFPSYDKGSDIYDSLVLKLDGAISSIKGNLSNAAVISPTTDDIMFGGNMEQWLLLANTIKLKLLLQQSAVSSKQAYIKSEAGNTSSEGYITADALVNPAYSSAQPSPMYGQFGTAPSGAVNGGFNYIRGNGTAIAFYKNTNDPRLGYFYGKNGTQPNDANNDFYSDILPIDKSLYNGDVLGIQATPTANSSGIGPGIVPDASQSAVLITAAESYFVQSEAVVRGYISGDAQQLYQDGITASFEYLNVGGDPDTYAQTYYSQPNVTNVSWPSTTSAQIATIITQKWAALNSINVYEAWNDWRRTFGIPNANSGYPVVPVSVSPTNTRSHMPFRLYYPLEEPNTNTANWKAAGGDQVDPFTSKIFWMP